MNAIRLTNHPPSPAELLPASRPLAQRRLPRSPQPAALPLPVAPIRLLLLLAASVATILSA
jgi:hypothetical protein